MPRAKVPAGLPVDASYLVSPLALAMTATSDTATPYEYAVHLDLLSQELVQLRARPKGWPRCLLITFPPRHGKSEMCSNWFPTWDIALEPSDKIILTSYEADFAASWGRKVRRNVHEFYPMIGARVMEDSKAAHRWETKEGGGMVTAGVGGPITGRGANIAICDDPIKNADEAGSQVMRDNLWGWWTTTFLTRLEADRHGNDPIVILIMTRWHEDDLAGRIMASPEFKFWRHLNLPALAEDDRDPLGRERGAALWPGHFDEETLDETRQKIGSRAFLSLYQGRPSPPEGAGIHRAWWQWYDEAPKDEEFETIIQSWDTTFKATDSSDFVAGGVIGRIHNRFYLLDGVHKRMNGPDTMKEIAAVDKRWPTAKRLLIEDTASGSMICDILERERGHVVRIKTANRAKETRLHWGVNSVAAIIERGQFFLKRGSPLARKLVDEAAQFPHGKHDDLIDMVVQGVEYLMPSAWAAENRLARFKAPPRDFVEATHRELWDKIHARVKERQKNAEKIAKQQERNSTFLV